MDSLSLSGEFVTKTVIPPPPLRLDYTLKCGQIFNWKYSKSENYIGFVKYYPISIGKIGGNLIITGENEAFTHIEKFFRFQDDLLKITQFLKKDLFLSRGISKFEGLRLIHQDSWGCLVGFLLSIVSNIPKIEATLERMGRYFGKKVDFEGLELFPIPSPEEIASLSEKNLRSFGMGFRARYLKACAKAVINGFPMKSLDSLPYSEAKKLLMNLPGIGEKVADCILLFGFGHLDAFPVDVWMQRILEKFYFNGKTKTPSHLSAWGRDKFGDAAGYAQQYLYTYGRLLLDRQSPFRNMSINT